MSPALFFNFQKKSAPVLHLEAGLLFLLSLLILLEGFANYGGR
jgi:hypothetical protein